MVTAVDAVYIFSSSPWFPPSSPSPRNIVLHGLEATGKSAVTAAVLSLLCRPVHVKDFEEDNGLNVNQPQLYHAILKSAECITGRHLLEATVGAIAEAVGWTRSIGRCESLAQLVVEVGRLLEALGQQTNKEGEVITPAAHFVLVFDGIDRQRDAPPTLLPALARLAEIAITSPRPHFLRISNVPHIHFYSYTKAEALKILALSPPPIYSTIDSPSSRSPSPEREHDEQSEHEHREFWTRFCSAVWDTLSKHSGRDVPSFRSTCLRLWPSFTAPIRDGTYSTKDFTRILVAKRSLLQDENLLVPTILPASTDGATNLANGIGKEARASGLISQLPITSRLLLVAAYLASYTPSRKDILLFSKAGARARKKKGGGTALSRARPWSTGHPKINRRLLGPQAFPLERMLAIYHAVRNESSRASIGTGTPSGAAGGSTADVHMAIATLASLRLLVKTSANADVLDASTKWRVNVGWEVVRGLARSVGVEVEDYITD
ncbi:MAG: hypothetical protein M1818_002398 [Claussenomyces sp. TS43310]|nr:MAG: hypothetical protein M1818_002398 [Claussenomyces sp. TS43310]